MRAAERSDNCAADRDRTWSCCIRCGRANRSARRSGPPWRRQSRADARHRDGANFRSKSVPAHLEFGLPFARTDESAILRGGVVEEGAVHVLIPMLEKYETSSSTILKASFFSEQYGQQRVIWPQHPDECSCLRHRHNDVRLAAGQGHARTGCLIPLLIPHTFRFLGLSFLIPGVVSPSLSPAFAVPAAYGDLVAAVLADIAILALAARVSWAIPIVWVFNVWGSIDLLHAIYQGQIRLGIDPDPWERRFSSRRRRPAVPRFTWRHFLAAIAARTRWPSVPTGQLRGCL